MKVEIIFLVCAIALSYAAEVPTTLTDIEATNAVQVSDSTRPLTRKARLIGGIGGIGGVGIVGGIGIVGGGVKGFGLGGGPGAIIVICVLNGTFKLLSVFTRVEASFFHWIYFEILNIVFWRKNKESKKNFQESFREL